MQVKDVLQKTTQFFRDKGIESARLDSELLISSALRWERMRLYLNYEYPLSDAELAACRENVKRRATGEPVAYILGEKGFYKHSFLVSPAVLIPRPETERLVEDVVEWLKSVEGEGVGVIDLGTGSGCIGLSILADEPRARLLAVDISEPALAIARANAERLTVSDRATFVSSDAAVLHDDAWVSALGGLADAVVANPPYIASDDNAVEADVKKFEPHSALFSPERGLAHIRAWAALAARALRPGGLAMFEIGHEQGGDAKAIFTADGLYEDVQILKDLSGRDRYVRAMRAQRS